MKTTACPALLALGLLAGCTYVPPYTYYQVACPAGAVVTPPVSSATVTPRTPAPPPAAAGETVSPTSPQAATVYSGSAIQTNCIAAVPNYSYGYYYPGYFGPPVYTSVFVGGRIH